MASNTRFPEWFNSDFPELDYGEPVDNVKKVASVVEEGEISEGIWTDDPESGSALDEKWSMETLHGSDADYPPARPRLLTLVEKAPLPKVQHERHVSWASMSDADKEFNPPKGPAGWLPPHQSSQYERTVPLSDGDDDFAPPRGPAGWGPVRARTSGGSRRRSRRRSRRSSPSPSYIPHWSSKKGVNRIRNIFPLIKSTRSRAMLLHQHMKEIFDIGFLPQERIPEVLQRFEDLVRSSDRAENHIRELIMDNDKYKCHRCPRSRLVVRPVPERSIYPDRWGPASIYPDRWRPSMDRPKSRSPDKRPVPRPMVPSHQLTNMSGSPLHAWPLPIPRPTVAQTWTLPIRSIPANRVRRAESIPPAIDWQNDGACDFDGASDTTVIDEDIDMLDGTLSDNSEISNPLFFSRPNSPATTATEVEDDESEQEEEEEEEEEDDGDSSEMGFDDEDIESLPGSEPQQPEIFDEEKAKLMAEVAALERDQVWGDGWSEKHKNIAPHEDYAIAIEDQIFEKETTGLQLHVLITPIPNYHFLTAILQVIHSGKIIGVQWIRNSTSPLRSFACIRFNTEEVARECATLIHGDGLTFGFDDEDDEQQDLEAQLLPHSALPLHSDVQSAIETGATRVLTIHHALDILIKCEPDLPGMARYFLRTKPNRAALANRAMQGLLKDLQCRSEDEYQLVECARLTKDGSLVIRFLSVHAAMKVKELMKLTVQYSLAKVTFGKDPCDPTPEKEGTSMVLDDEVEEVKGEDDAGEKEEKDSAGVDDMDADADAVMAIEGEGRKDGETTLPSTSSSSEDCTEEVQPDTQAVFFSAPSTQVEDVSTGNAAQVTSQEELAPLIPIDDERVLEPIEVQGEEIPSNEKDDTGPDVHQDGGEKASTSLLGRAKDAVLKGLGMM